jgi:hypothetical protein
MKWFIRMNLKDGDEKDEKGQAKDKIISLYLKSLNQLGKELTDKCFVDLEISIYSWVNSVDHAPPKLFRREN